METVFGDLEECCDNGVNSLHIWLNFINLRSDIRNDLTIFLCDTKHLNDHCYCGGLVQHC